MKYTSWQSANGRWQCNATDELGNNKSKWWYPARVMNISLTDYVHLLLDYDAEIRSYDVKHDVLIYSFATSASAKNFCNYINKICN